MMTKIPQTRQSLILELGKLSDDAWTEFLQVYEKALFRFCLAKGLQEADARDVLQEVLTAVLLRIPTWEAGSSLGSFRGWLFRVARNIAVDTIADRARKTSSTGDPMAADLLSQVPNQNVPVETSLEIEYQRSLFEWASNQVKTEVREITWKSFRMTAVEGQKAESVAKELGISIGSVYTAKCRVVARIRTKISEMDVGLQPDVKRNADGN